MYLIQQGDRRHPLEGLYPAVGKLSHISCTKSKLACFDLGALRYAFLCKSRQIYSAFNFHSQKSQLQKLREAKILLLKLAYNKTIVLPE